MSEENKEQPLGERLGLEVLTQGVASVVLTCKKCSKSLMNIIQTNDGLCPTCFQKELDARERGDFDKTKL